VRWLQAHFENAHFVAIVRNGYAVAEGITRKADPKHLVNSWPVEMSAWQWKRSNEILQHDAQHLKHLLWVKYEDLAADTESTLKKITDFVGINAFASFAADKSWSIHEREEQVRDMNQESIARLSRTEIARINQVAGDMIESFGYTRL
jgi:hypothetical protein